MTTEAPTTSSCKPRDRTGDDLDLTPTTSGGGPEPQVEEVQKHRWRRSRATAGGGPEPQLEEVQNHRWRRSRATAGGGPEPQVEEVQSHRWTVMVQMKHHCRRSTVGDLLQKEPPPPRSDLVDQAST
ncbi:hypothetical protein INR49_022625 [Caranx melampygus]|nr:hypothetical protein INR49_022625 [Caranx melampygus]